VVLTWCSSPTPRHATETFSKEGLHCVRNVHIKQKRL
jgi:hypothetical protein